MPKIHTMIHFRLGLIKPFFSLKVILKQTFKIRVLIKNKIKPIRQFIILIKELLAKAQKERQRAGSEKEQEREGRKYNGEAGETRLLKKINEILFSVLKPIFFFSKN